MSEEMIAEVRERVEQAINERLEWDGGQSGVELQFEDAKALLAAAYNQRLREADAETLMREFYVSRYYEPKAERPADNVKAAIEFALSAYNPNERLREALRPFAAAASLFTSAVHNGGLENVQAFPTPEEWRRLIGLFPEYGGAVRKSSKELRSALSPLPQGED